MVPAPRVFRLRLDVGGRSEPALKVAVVEGPGLDGEAGSQSRVGGRDVAPAELPGELPSRCHEGVTARVTNGEFPRFFT